MKDSHIIQFIVGIEKEIEVLGVKEEQVNGVTYKVIEVLNSRRRVRCPYCNKFTSRAHDFLKPIKIKYVKIEEYPVILSVHKRRFDCDKCGKRFTEEMYLNNSNKTLSNKLERKILKDLKEPNLSIKYIANINHVSQTSVRRILDKAIDLPEYQRLLPSVLSFDEFKADTNKGKYAFIVNDLLHKKTIDILPSRKKEELVTYFTKAENRSSVQYVVSDMYEPYLLVTTICFPKARYVVDRFHYIRYIMDALDKIRIRLQKEYGYNSKEYRLLKNKKNTSLLRKYGRDIEWFVYTQRYRNGHMVDVLPKDILDELFEIDDDLKYGYQLKELFLDIVNHSEYDGVETDLKTWIDLCYESKIEEFENAAMTIDNWLPYIANSFIDKRFSNGYTEGLNNKIKVIKRNGHGYRNFDFFRKRIMYILKSEISGKVKKDSFQKSEKTKK
jgi:transposase